MQINERTISQIAEIRKRWADAEQQEAAEREAQERDQWARLNAALLQTEKRFLPPCQCDEFLSNTLEGRKPQCAHFDGAGLVHILTKQGF